MKLGILFCFIPKLFKNNKMTTMNANSDTENLNKTLKQSKRNSFFRKPTIENSTFEVPDGNHILSETEEEKNDLQQRMNKIYYNTILLEKLS